MKSVDDSSGLLASALLYIQMTKSAEAILKIIFIKPIKNTNINNTKNEYIDVKNEVLKKNRGLAVFAIAPTMIEIGKKLTDAASTDDIPVTQPIIIASFSLNCPIKLFFLKRNATIPPISPKAKIMNNCTIGTSIKTPKTRPITPLKHIVGFI